MIQSDSHQCDGCKTPIYTNNSNDYVLMLSSEEVRERSGAVTDMNILPPLDRPYYFCGLGCLDIWLRERQ